MRPSLSRGVIDRAVLNTRSRSTPTGIVPEEEAALLVRPAGPATLSQDEPLVRSRVLERSPVNPTMPRGCQVRPAEFRHRWVRESVGVIRKSWAEPALRRASSQPDTLDRPLLSRTFDGTRLKVAYPSALPASLRRIQLGSPLMMPPNGSRGPRRSI